MLKNYSRGCIGAIGVLIGLFRGYIGVLIGGIIGVRCCKVPAIYQNAGKRGTSCQHHTTG